MVEKTIEIDGDSVVVEQYEGGYIARKKPEPVEVVEERSMLDERFATYTDVRGKVNGKFDVAVRVRTPKKFVEAPFEEQVGGEIEYIRAIPSDGVYDGRSNYNISEPKISGDSHDVIFFVDSGISD